MDRKHPLRKFLLVAMILLTTPSCLFRRHRDEVELNPGDQPDKILYEKATREIERNHFDVGRLTLQTLINTYPDSEYLSRAKLSIADSYYHEGGTSGLTQAEAEYKDFITFFPTAPEAPEAQFRAGMAHYRMMSKSDRDRSEAKLAEAEFKEFLLKYPDSHVMPRVKARLRQVQEVLAQGDYKIAQFYYSKRAFPAARSRLQEIADNYPNFSQGDAALWYLGKSLEALRRPGEAATYYSRVITEHPLSAYVGPVKERLAALKQPIPQPTRAVLARAEADAARRPGKDLFQKVGSFLSGSPDVSATRHGPVRLGAPKPGPVQVASGAQGTPRVGTVVAAPVGDEALKSGTPINSSSAAESGNEATASKPPDPGNIKSKSQETPDPAKKKKSLFKKIIKPF
ncbi:MAG: outer membrane protein assembly factor BamD [Acidobacteria bacterium]|nr:outer membrane protein assembly factor BamD [Acidobacteriota bacterium]